jgi:hypothetical protein
MHSLSTLSLLLLMNNCLFQALDSMLCDFKLRRKLFACVEQDFYFLSNMTFLL